MSLNISSSAITRSAIDINTYHAVGSPFLMVNHFSPLVIVTSQEWSFSMIISAGKVFGHRDTFLKRPQNAASGDSSCQEL